MRPRIGRISAGALVTAVSLGLAASCAPPPPLKPVGLGSRPVAFRPPGPASCAASPGQKAEVPFSVIDPIWHAYVARLHTFFSGPPSPDLIGGTSFTYGHGSKQSVLLSLDGAGGMRSFTLPIQPDGASLHGNRVWFVEGDRGPDGPPRMVSVDVSNPASPSAGPVQPIHDMPPATLIDAFSFGDRYALFVTRPLDPPGSESTAALWDLRTARRVGSGRSYDDRLSLVDAWCVSEGCALVAFQGRLFTLELPASGPPKQHALTSDSAGVGAAAVIPLRAGALVVWARTEPPSLEALRVDALGRPLGDVARYPLPSPLRTLVRMRGPDAHAVAWSIDRTKHVWWSAEIDAETGMLGEARRIPMIGESNMTAAPIADGSLFVGFTTDVSYDDQGEYHFHSWTASIRAGFEGAASKGRGAPEPPVTLASFAGDGRGGWHAVPMVAPGRASALLIPGGDAYGTAALVPVRVPCPRANAE